MKITDPQVIVDGEQDLIASLQKDLDLDVVKSLLKERLAMASLTPGGGKIVAHNNEVAFRLDFSVNLNGSLLFDRNGDLIQEEAASFLDADTDEIAADQAILDKVQEETQLTDEDPEEELAINLPDFDQEPPDAEDLAESSGDDTEDVQTLTADPGLEVEELESDDFKNEELENQELENQEFENAFQEDEVMADQGPAMLKEDDKEDLLDDLAQDLDDDSEDIDELQDLEPKEDVDPAALDLDQNQEDDDISDILKESRDFWEQKKG